jgi:hypothetical protein
MGLGARAGLHLYLPTLLGLTVGIGGEALIGRSHAEPTVLLAGPPTGATSASLRPVTETFKSISPQLSLVPSGGEPQPADEDPIQTINYGGGARWFIKPRLAFSLDVRFYDIASVEPELGFPGSPRTVLLVIGAGLSIK